MNSTSICGSTLTPACWARSRSSRRVGSTAAQRASARISGAAASASIVIGAATRAGSIERYSSSSRCAGRMSSPVASIGSATSPASSSPSRTASATSAEFCPTTRTRTVGWRVRKSCTSPPVR